MIMMRVMMMTMIMMIISNDNEVVMIMTMEIMKFYEIQLLGFLP